MSDSALSDRYSNLIEQIIQMTLKGNIRSKEQVYQMLAQEIEPDSGEIFEVRFRDRFMQTQTQANDKSDELKQAKAVRAMRALHTIEGEWKRWQAENQNKNAIATSIRQLNQADKSDRLLIFLTLSDPNHPDSLNADQLKQLAITLRQQSISDIETQQELAQLSDGILRGLQSWNTLQPHLISWIYNPEQLGFGDSSQRARPWELWAKQAIGNVLKSFFTALDQNQAASQWAESQTELMLSDWIEFAIVVQTLQRGLVSWAENQSYSAKAGTSLSVSIFLTFALIWSELASGFSRSSFLNSINRSRFSEASFRVTLQILRIFAQRDYFPLYGTIYTSFTGAYFRDAMNYLSEPLKRTEGTQEKARILTLIGSTQRVLGAFDTAKEIHTTAKEIAQEAGDRKCEIANLNHLSRISINQKNYAEAIGTSQRALILSRQSGDRMGEANALANLGYAEVFQAQLLESDPDAYELAIGYLEQGLALSEKLGDLQSQALCSLSLGSAYVTLNDTDQAFKYLEQGSYAAAESGDRYLQALCLSYFGEAFYQRQDNEKAILASALAMYKLEQMGTNDWRTPAGLLTILRGQLGERFDQILQTQRSKLIVEIGVDGFDYLAELLDLYRQS
ncbi:MAG: tetratricopeptide repeat protein [Phormidium tanganyikae FI6-MK23]|jgi:tetratricopeptide (TPR) repeat protein|nr:tetratricopeptide repeat protein [Phormidium tanganyikae FI6-MK23]